MARALDVVGERWALLVVRELLLGPKRFTDLRAGLPHVSADVLAQRLRELEEAGILGRHKLAPPAASRVYELTPRGRELEPVVLALGRWGSVAPFPGGGSAMSVDSLLIALRTLFDPALADGLDASYELRIDEHSFQVEVAGGRLQIARGSAATADAIIEADPATLSRLLWHGRELRAALEAGEITVTGSRPATKRFLGLFPLPSVAAAATA